MSQYRVSLHFNVDASNPWEAAEFARECLENPSGHFEVEALNTGDKCEVAVDEEYDGDL